MADVRRYAVNPDPEDDQALVEDPKGNWVHLVDYRRLEAELKFKEAEVREIRPKLEALEEWRYGRSS